MKSDEPKCKKGDVVAVRLRQGNDVAVVRLGGCAGIRREFIWRDPASTLAVAVKEVRIKR